jgi:hypothetical protein
VLHFAEALASGISTAAASGFATIAVPEGGRIKLESNAGATTVVTEAGEPVDVNFDDLRTAVIQFRRALARLLDEEIPGMRGLPAYTRWFDDLI